MKKSLWLVLVLVLACVLALSSCVIGRDQSYTDNKEQSTPQPSDTDEEQPSDETQDPETDAHVHATKGLLYDMSSDGTYYEVVGYSGESLDVIIANEYNNLPVKSICSSVFKGKAIRSVIIPDNIITIGSSAFYNCTNLSNVIIGNDVAFIEGWAFRNCYALKTIDIPDSVLSIGNGAFVGCANLTEVMIGRQCSSIGIQAFSGCNKLQKINIPDNIVSIGYDAFDGCSNLNFSIVDNVKYLGNEDNPFLALIEVDNPNYREYTIHIDTKCLADYAFSNCSRLEKMNIPSGICSWGNSVFRNCTNLTEIIFSEGVLKIGSDSFSGCSNLKSISLPNSITHIGNNAFGGCSALKTVYYYGQDNDWSKISIGSFNTYLLSATLYFYSEMQPTGRGNYWHYVDGVPTIWE